MSVTSQFLLFEQCRTPKAKSNEQRSLMKQREYEREREREREVESEMKEVADVSA